MKKVTYLVGYFAAFATATATVFKLTHLEFTGIVILIAMTFMTIYFFFYIIDKMSDASDGKILPIHYLLSFCAVFLNMGVLFKFEHWPMASILLTIGLVGLSLIFFPLLLIQKSKIPGTNNIMNIAGSAGLILFGLGVLTKVQHWPGQIYLLAPGILLVFLVYFPMLMMNKEIPEEQKVNQLRDTFFAIIIGCLLLLFAWGMVGGKLLPPPPDAATTEQSK